jgi:hypothetical protein
MQVISLANALALSPALPTFIERHKSTIENMLRLMVEARYILKCLQKDIEHGRTKKMDKGQMWEKVYIGKFMPRKIYY